jgi:folate-binding protein YgfZ
MSVPTGVDLSTGPGALGVLFFKGTDARRFLQGQLSADIEKLAPAASTLAGLHNPQGRVIAVMALACDGDDEFLAILPRELVTGVAQRLRKFVLRAKVEIADWPDWRVIGVDRPPARIAVAPIRWSDRWLLVTSTAGEVQGIERAAWDCADIFAGIPQVYASTSETFVAQMLNLDLLGAIAFDKGCYTGQEVIARAHYRGRVKRRLQRWHCASDITLQPGQAAQSTDGRTLIVVRAAANGGNGQEVLAVGNYHAEPAAEGSGAATEGPILSGPLPLPYALPE